MKCKRCKSEQIIKSGKPGGKQRYKCNSCKHYFVKTSSYKKQKRKTMAIALYLEGLGVRSVARIMKVSHVSVLNWIKLAANELHTEFKNEEVESIELDELYFYLGKKRKSKWLWLAVDKMRRKIIDFEVGCRGFQTAFKLWSRIKQIPCKQYFTDHWVVYPKLLISEQHISSRSETYTIEGINSAIRHYLARFRRKSKCYSKSEEMVKSTMKLFLWKYNYI